MDEVEIRLTGYDLFVKIAKSLSLKLPHEKDRVLAAKWIRKIDNLMDLDYPQKIKYLKLLNVSMQSKVLVGPFSEPPPTDDFDIMDLYNLRPVDVKDMVTYQHKMNIFTPHPYFAEVSNDLKEYCVVQEIPEFGTHFYYASSLEPITEWRNHKHAILPKGALESSVIIPPNPLISESKEEFVNNYKQYVKNFRPHGGGHNAQGQENCDPEPEVEEKCDHEVKRPKSPKQRESPNKGRTMKPCC